MRFRTADSIKQEFIQARIAQAEAEFLRRCDLPAHLEASALAVRAAIANLAGVDVCLVHADDRFDTELLHFDFWGSLDTIAVVLELEQCLGVPISDAQSQKLPNPEFVPGPTVAEWVRRVVDELVERRDGDRPGLPGKEKYSARLKQFPKPSVVGERARHPGRRCASPRVVMASRAGFSPPNYPNMSRDLFEDVAGFKYCETVT